MSLTLSQLSYIGGKRNISMSFACMVKFCQRWVSIPKQQWINT